MSTPRKKKKHNSKYTAPYKSTNYLESGYNPPMLWSGAPINQEGTYINLEQPINRNEPAYNNIISYEEANADYPKYGNSDNSFNLGSLKQSGAYNTIGSTASGYFASKAASADSDSDKYYNTGMAIASKAGPVGSIVGGVTAIGDSIGDPIRNRVATTDEQGNIKDIRGFEAGNVVGSYLNPFKSVTETFGKNSSATKGEKALSILGMSGDPLSLGIGTLLSGRRRRQDIENAEKAKIEEAKRLESERLANEKAIKDAEAKRLSGIRRVSNMEIDSRYLNPSNQSFAKGGNINEHAFNLWFKYNTPEGRQGWSSDDTRLDYDYRSYYRDAITGKNPMEFDEKTHHFPDTYKYPIHPTFSVESKYYRGEKETPALSWDGTGFKKAEGGDITEYNGYRHEDGGLNLGQAEVEDGETRGIPNTSTEDYIFSDRLKTLNNKTTFAMKSKNISKKYSLRPWDPISNNAKSRELDVLSKENDIVRKAGELEEAIKAYEGNLKTTDTNNAQYAKGGWIQKATASIKRRGTEGKCTPITKPGCTGRARALALTFKKMARNRSKEEGGELYPEGGDLPPVNVTNVPVKYVEPVDPNRVYIPSHSGSGIAVSTTKRTDSIIGDLMSEINERYNTTENSKTKRYYRDLRKFLANHPTTRLRGTEELDYYKNADSRLKGLLEQPTTMGKFKKRGFEFAGGGDFFSGVGNYISSNPELINTGVQGVVQALRSRKINRLQPNTLDYTPISYLNESTYAAPLSGIAYRPIRNEEQIRGINTAYKGAEKAAADYSDSGDYLNRMTAIGASKAANVGKAYEDYYNQEATRRMQIDQYNKGIQGQNLGRLTEVAMRNKAIEEANVRNKLITQEYSNAEKDALTSLKLQNYGDWTNYLTGATNDLAKRRAYEDMMTIEGSKYPNYEFYRDKNGKLKSRLRTKATT